MKTGEPARAFSSHMRAILLEYTPSIRVRIDRTGNNRLPIADTCRRKSQGSSQLSSDVLPPRESSAGAARHCFPGHNALVLCARRKRRIGSQQHDRSTPPAREKSLTHRSERLSSLRELRQRERHRPCIALNWKPARAQERRSFLQKEKMEKDDGFRVEWRR